MSMGPVNGPNGPGDLLAALKSGRVQGGETARLRSASQLMEAQFYQELFKAMRASVPEDRLMGGGEGEEMFTSLMDQQLAESAAGQSERGIGVALYRHFLSQVSPEAAASEDTDGSEPALTLDRVAPATRREAMPVNEELEPISLERGAAPMPLDRPTGPISLDGTTAGFGIDPRAGTIVPDRDES